MECFHVSWNYLGTALVAKDCLLQMSCYVSAMLMLVLFNNQKDIAEYAQV